MKEDKTLLRQRAQAMKEITRESFAELDEQLKETLG